MEEKSNAFLEREPVGKLMGKYAVPCIISLLVAGEMKKPSGFLRNTSSILRLESRFICSGRP